MFKSPVANLDGVKSEEVDPRLVFHYGIPSGAILLAYDSIQQILAISTKDGQIKLYGSDYSQAILESTVAVPSKFLKVWDINMKVLSHVHVFKEEITSFTVIQQSLFMYVGDSTGTISVLKLDKEPWNIVQMKYCIPLSASHGEKTFLNSSLVVSFIFCSQQLEFSLVLVIYRDGFITLWAIQESKAIFSSGGNILPAVSHESKKVTAACWACPFGSKVVVGYSNGEILIWSVPPASASKTEPTLDKHLYATQSAPICKLNLGYKLDKIPIGSLKWVYADGKASRLYIKGLSDAMSANLLQVVLLNEQTETRTIKLGLHSSEPCVDMEIISNSNEQNKRKQDALLLLGKSGRVYAYDDFALEKYLLQSLSKSPPSLPKEILVKLPYADSSICIAKFITENQYSFGSGDEGSSLLEKLAPSLFSFDMKLKDATQSTQFSGFSKSKNLYITGHNNGAINFWDASCPAMLPIASVVQQSEADFSSSGVALTALYFDCNWRLLISGDQSGMIRIFGLKSESFSPVNSFISLQGISKKGSNHIVQSLKLVKVNGAVLSIAVNFSSRRLAVGSDLGYVSLIDMEVPTVLYQKHFASELCTGVISMQFETCSFHGFEKNVIVVATKDSSVLAIEGDTGNTLGSGLVGPTKPSKALFMQVLGNSLLIYLVTSSYVSRPTHGKESVLICSEKATYVYSLQHVVQGIKQVLYKKKFHSSSCCWASTFHTPDAAGLILVFLNGTVQIRSLPDLSLLKETSIRGLTLSTPKLNSVAAYAMCSSLDGELVVVNGDQEMFFVSILLQKNTYRHLDSVSRVYKKDLITVPRVISAPVIPQEKKKGIFGSLMKDKTGSKAKQMPEEEAETASIEDLSTIFSVDNFPSFAESRANLAMDEDEVALDIDDIDLGDPQGKPKGNPIMAALNKQKLTSKFQALNKQISVQTKEVPTKEVPIKEEPQEEKAGSVDQIKKKYGFGLSGDSSAAKMARDKLSENVKKLQGINIRTTEMQNSAQSFSSMAKEVLRLSENDKKSS
ncbi:hypothetical protein RHGRI_030393 [Rhododendron griersonianum]|uniref:Lethal giant larvae (Lgl)-like C-terminal domain-containing protein n=1 Tax=Rhododendron griersonianum TaxID=479676 RepID=A0AAV6IT66_9ERIC|nr:hypothetical protein RHGRI_030393 [Rhododendron griersonianum]